MDDESSRMKNSKRDEGIAQSVIALGTTLDALVEKGVLVSRDSKELPANEAIDWVGALGEG